MDTELFKRSLGLVEPWTVSAYEVDEDKEKITFFVEHEKDSLLHCAHCERKYESCVNLKKFNFEYLSFFQYKCCMSINVPVVRCSEGVEELANFYMKPNEHTIFCPILSECSG